MEILGIESSCDDTSAALVRCDEQGFFVVQEKTASQVAVHARYGGVVPEVAGRLHAEHIMPVIEEVMKDQKLPDAIAVTAGPGLITGLVVGVEAAKVLSYLLDIPIVRVNHIEGHIHSVFLGSHRAPLLPALCLVVSGGHTELLLMRDYGVYELVGKTRDDAAGEAFDKVGKLIGLDYPGGPKMSQLAETGNRSAINFPRPMLESSDFDFSFAGLKTAALYWLRDNAVYEDGIYRPANAGDFCASFEQAVIDVLVQKTKRAAALYNPKTIILAGGVSANSALKKNLAQALPSFDIRFPASGYSMDNGAMIAMAAYHHAIKQDFTPWRELIADPNWKVYEND